MAVAIWSLVQLPSPVTLSGVRFGATNTPRPGTSSPRRNLPGTWTCRASREDDRACGSRCIRRAARGIFHGLLARSPRPPLPTPRSLPRWPMRPKRLATVALQPPNIVAALTDIATRGAPVAHGVFDPTPRDADVSERTIVELMELADGAAQEPFIGQVARQPSAPRTESAEPLRQPAHGAAHAGFDDETVETGLPLGLQE